MYLRCGLSFAEGSPWFITWFITWFSNGYDVR